MKTYQKLTSMVVLAWAVTQGATHVLAQPEPPAVAAESAPAAEPAPTSKHLKLCAMLGLKVGRTYEFLLTGNEEIHYWQIRSLGEDGWILAKDARYPATWVNLSQVIAITPLPITRQAERPKKPNRDR
jgi:hypothetical protein